MLSNNKETSVEVKAKNADLATRFMHELLGSVETLVGIADEFGSRTLADLMYLQAAIIEDRFIDSYPDESKVFQIIDGLPSREQWKKYVKTEYMAQVDDHEVRGDSEGSCDKSEDELIQNSIIITDYLKTRRYNRNLLKSAIRECDPILKQYNACILGRKFTAVLVFCMNAKTQELEATVNTYVNHQINECEEDESERYNAYLGDLARKIEPILVKFYGKSVCFEESTVDCSYKASLKDKRETSENEDFYH